MAEIPRRRKSDRYSQISLLSTSEFTFRFYLSIAETFVKTWMKFPVPLIPANVDAVSELLESRNRADFDFDFDSLKEFSLSVLKEMEEALVCVNSVVVEIIRFVFCLFCIFL